MNSVNYTYDDFREAAKRAGLINQFSDADMRLAEANPNLGMGLLQSKQDYRAATSDEQRAAANSRAESYRKQGGYTGGSDGSGYNPINTNPVSFQSSAVKPTYTPTYDKQKTDLINAILNRKEFSYDAEKDPLFEQYKKQYTREGRRATEDTLGAVSAQTGGLPSSYAVSAAAQAGNYYASQLSDKIPELYQAAYNRYLQDYNDKIRDLGMLDDQENILYDRYLRDLDQYNNEYNREYKQLLDENDFRAQQRAEERQLDETAYNRSRDAVADARYDAQYNDEAAKEDYQRQYNEAVLAAQYGDYSGLERLGITPNMANLAMMTSASSVKGATGSSAKGTTGSKTAEDQSVGNKDTANDRITNAINRLNTEAAKMGNYKAVKQNADGTISIGDVGKAFIIHNVLSDDTLTEDEANMILASLGITLNDISTAVKLEETGMGARSYNR